MKQRVLSAFVALLITLPLLLLGGIYFKILVVVLGVLGIKEIIDVKKDVPLLLKIFMCFLYVIGIFTNYITLKHISTTYLVLSIFTLFFPVILFHDDKKYNMSDALYLLSSLIFLTIAFKSYIFIRNKSLLVTIYLLLITILSDTFALLVGMKYGKNKLVVSISPNKTNEGLIGGVILGTLISSVFYILCIDSANIIVTIVITLLLSIIGSLGDLIFSQIKRHFGIKDFSNIMPGHGGILDRLDSSIFVFLTYIILMMEAL